ncbi:hypothetical protein Tco_0812603, partial [Tanacetum coccineum]
SKDRNGREDNKRTRNGNAFATTTNPVRKEYTGMEPKCTVTPRLGGNIRRNIMDIITTQWCQQ